MDNPARPLPIAIAALVLLAAPLVARPDAPERPTVAEFQRRIDEYGRLWTMRDGKIDLTKLDRFYAPGDGVIIFDFAPPGVSRSWDEHRRGLERELFSNLVENRFVPRRDVTLRLVGDSAAVTTFTFDYDNVAKDGTCCTRSATTRGTARTTSPSATPPRRPSPARSSASAAAAVT